MRIDRLLCHLRFVRTRSRAAQLVMEGHLRRNGERVIRASQPVSVGDVLTVPLGRAVHLVEILALPERRGPPREARECYRLIGPTQSAPTDQDDERGLDSDAESAIAPGRDTQL